MKFRVFMLVTVGVMALAFPALGYPPSANLPLDSRIYPALDKLAALGLVNSALQGTRPYTRGEAARQLLEARGNAAPGGFPPVVNQLLRLLEGELKDQLPKSSGATSTHRSYLKPLRSFSLEYIYWDGQPSSFPGTNAHQLDLDINKFGLDQAGSHSGRFSFESEARLAELFLLSMRPVFEWQQNDVDVTGTNLELLEGRAALSLGPIEVSTGRQALWWGQGRHGSLILTNNAQPLDMLRITNPVPSTLPWVFHYLGPFRFDVFWSRLEEKRTVPEPYFAGLRLSFKPLPNLELGASRTAIFGGQGRPDINFSDFLTILTGKNLSGGEDTSNQLAALDARLRLPYLRGIELYGEWGGEDEAGGFVSNHAYLAGLYLPQLEPSGRLSLRLEYADLSHIADNAPPWYHHAIYRSGYTYEQKILGHHVGGAAKDSFAELELTLPQNVTLSLSCDYQERGFDRPVRETHLQPTLGLEWHIQENVATYARYAMSEVENFAFSAGEDRTFQQVEVGGRIVW